MRLRRRLRAVRRRLLAPLRQARSGPPFDPADRPMGTIFVGGTGRSGTTITSGLLGRHPDWKRLHTEVKFISNHGGLADLVEGRTTFRRFERRIMKRWWSRGERKGLKLILSRRDIEDALVQLQAGLRTDRARAAATFAHRLLDPLAEQERASGWIEMTPNAALTARTLLRMFPDMKLLHLVRDGRDVACSVLKMSWGPNEPHAALDWWARRLEQGFAACEGLPADRVMVMHLEDLVIRDRERTYDAMLAFLEMPDQPEMRQFFDTRMPADAMHSGRWRKDIPTDMQAAFDAHYWELVDRITARGFPYRGEPREAAASA